MMDEISEIIILLESEQLKDEEKFLDFIINRYKKTLDQINRNQLKENLIKGSVRAFLEVYSDYKSPLLGLMNTAEKDVEQFKTDI